ncbi:siderophore-iron reductase FhuF [Rhizobium sp. YIM 134829]|uniref:siderophore-iron reductase FhuF n=1 Tax=Rhizobium sp. YIM 134829 TaxID=3390453 RepID=UPI00397C4A67
MTVATVFDPPGLKTVFAGEHAWCGEKMKVTAALEGAVPLSQFFASGAFEAALQRYGEAHPGGDRRAIVSMWSLYYFSALAIPFIVARRAERLLPVSLGTMTIALAEDGLPRAFGLIDEGVWSDEGGEDLARAVVPLLRGHLEPVVDRLKSRAGMAPKLAWNNVAVYLDYAFNATATTADAETWPARPLFEADRLADGGVNPFKGCLKRESDEMGPEPGRLVCRRKVCCLRYLLPGIPSCGALCALPAQRH